MTNEEYVDFVKYTSGALHSKGLLLYTIPFPEGKAKKHGFDVLDNMNKFQNNDLELKKREFRKGYK